MPSTQDTTTDEKSPLRLVLLGKTGTGKSASGNTILGRKVFQSELSFNSVTVNCKEAQAEVDGRHVTVIDTPGLFDTAVSMDEIKTKIEKCMDLSFPGPHAFLLVMRLDTPLMGEDRNAVQWIQENFGEVALKYTVVLFTHGDALGNVKVKDYLEKSPDLLKSVKEFGNRYHVFNNKKKNKSQVSDLLMIIDRMEKYNRGYYTRNMFQEVQKKMEENQRKAREEREMKNVSELDLEEERKRRERAEEKARKEERMRKAAEEEVEVERKRKQEAENEAEQERRRKREALAAAEKEREQKLEAQKAADEDRKRKLEAEEEAHVQWKRTREAENLADEERKKREEAEKKIQELEKKRKVSPLRIVLLGKTGTGKSASGNSILGKTAFVTHHSYDSVTENCTKGHTEVDGRQITVIDTPGLFDTKKSSAQVKTEIESCIGMSDPGPHVFLLAIRLDVRFTKEERDAVNWIQETFGEKASQYTMVLITHGDMLKRRVEDYLKESSELSSFFRKCRGRYHVLNNTEKDSRQVHELLEKIEDLVKLNGGFYTMRRTD